MKLSIIIPARNEEFLGRTIQDLLENIEDETEIIAVLDGYLPDPPLPVSDKVTVIYNPISVGQRASANQAAKLAKGKYLMKIDAHCAFDKGFDRKMLEGFKESGDNVTMIPIMRNLHVFDWVCDNGHRRYQSPSGDCEECGKPTTKDIVWYPKPSPKSVAYRFDKTMHFQYHNDYAKSLEFRYGLILGYKLSFDTRSVSPSVISLLTDLASSHQLACGRNLGWFRQNVSSNTVGFSSVDNSWSIGTDEVRFIRNKLEMQRVTTSSVITKMVNNRDTLTSTSGNTVDKPSIDDSVCECFLPENSTPTISSFVNPTDPIPAPGSTINSDFIEEINNKLGGKFIYSEKTRCFHNGSIMLFPIVDKEMNLSLSIQGSCFMITKEKWFELDICSEDFHSWGQQGVEVACKTWLSGGRVLVNRKTWYAHMFRTRGGDFGFPYPNPQNRVNENREKSRQLFQKDNWPKATRKFQWLLDKFNPPDWKETKGMIYYTPNDLDEKIAKPVRDNLAKISQEKKMDIVCSSLKKMDFGTHRVRFPTQKKGYVTMFKQILGALEKSRDEIIFFCEHDIWYSNEHFDFNPLREDTFYYNINVWRTRLSDGHSLKTDDCRQLSGLCVYRDAALTHFRERFELAEQKHKELVKNGDETKFNRWVRHCGFEPFTHNRIQWKNQFRCEVWSSGVPNIDIKHKNNATGERWRKDQYRNQRWTEGWTESEGNIPGWGDIRPILAMMK